MSDLISRQAALEVIGAVFPVDPMKSEYAQGIACGAALAKTYVEQLPSAQPEIVQCKDCKHNPKLSWFGCPMSHLSEAQRPETAWCWKAERREVTT